MKKKLLSILLAMLISVTLGVPGFANEIEATANGDLDMIVSYDFVSETFQPSSTSNSRAISNMDLPPYNPPASRSFDTTIDPDAFAEFEAAGLIYENGDFNWDALMELPTLEPAQETDETPGVGGRTVIGTDDRRLVSSTTTIPYRYVAFVLANYNGQYYRGTAFSVGNNAFGTAGHNLYNAGRGWATSVTVIPARNGNTYPYGSTTSRRLRSVTGWTQQGLPEYDYGLIETVANLANTIGYCGIRATTANIVGEHAEVPGYPGEVRGVSTYQMYTDSGPISRQTGLRVYYNMDTSGGNSGGPVFVSGSLVTAIHAYGSTSGNSGRRVDDPVRNLFMEYR